MAQPKVSSLALSHQWWRVLEDPQLDALMPRGCERLKARIIGGDKLLASES
ncbi:hypothetical protein OQA87_08460 [Yersinia intermedia]|nr:hypothetical protein [Yersinia intermedia]